MDLTCKKIRLGELVRWAVSFDRAHTKCEKVSACVSIRVH